MVTYLLPQQILTHSSYTFLGTIFLGVCFIQAILPHRKYLEHKLLATLLNRSACVGATSCTLALDWLESRATCWPDCSKQWSFSLWRLNSLDVFQKSKSIFQISKFMSIFLFFLLQKLKDSATSQSSLLEHLLNPTVQKQKIPFLGLLSRSKNSPIP